MATISKRVRKPLPILRAGDGGNIYILIGLVLDRLLSLGYNIRMDEDEMIDFPDDSDWDAPEHDDAYDIDSALGSAGYGTDEWYGNYEAEEDFLHE